MRLSISIKMRVAVTLWFLATNADYRTIGHLFGVLKVSVCLIRRCAIVKVLLPKYIKVPVGSSLTSVINGFERFSSLWWSDRRQPHSHWGSTENPCGLLQQKGMAFGNFTGDGWPLRYFHRYFVLVGLEECTMHVFFTIPKYSWEERGVIYLMKG